MWAFNSIVSLHIPLIADSRSRHGFLLHASVPRYLDSLASPPSRLAPPFAWSRQLRGGLSLWTSISGFSWHRKGRTSPGWPNCDLVGHLFFETLWYSGANQILIQRCWSHRSCIPPIGSRSRCRAYHHNWFIPKPSGFCENARSWCERFIDWSKLEPKTSGWENQKVRWFATSASPWMYRRGEQHTFRHTREWIECMSISTSE